MKKCKNKKYCKGPPFGVFVKNMKYVPHFVAHLVYVPDVPDSWHSCGTKTSSAQFGLRSSFREGRSFFISIFNRWGKGPNEKNGQKVAKIDDFSIFHPSTLTVLRFFIPQPSTLNRHGSSVLHTSTLNPHTSPQLTPPHPSSPLLIPPPLFNTSLPTDVCGADHIC